MTAGLTPTLALAYLRELSTDVRAALVLDADGAPLAGDAPLAPRAGELLAAMPAGAGRRVELDPAGTTVVVRAGDGTALVVSAGSHALTALLLHDLQRILADLVRR